MKVLRLKTARPGGLEGQNPERVATLSGEIFARVMEGTSGPIEALAAIALVADMLSQTCKNNGMTDEDMRGLVALAEEFEQTMRPVVVNLPKGTMMEAPGSPPGSIPS